MVPSLNDFQSVPWPSAFVVPLIGRPYTPPSLPTKTNGVPLANMKAVRDYTCGEVTLEEMVPDARHPVADEVRDAA